MAERRKFHRLEFRKELMICAPGSQPGKRVQFYAKGVDISRGGIRLYTIARFEPDSPAQVTFRSDLGATIEREGRIVRIIEEDRPADLKESETVYAFEFDQPFTEKQFAAVV